MRFMITCRIPMEKANELATVGSLCSTIQSRMDELRASVNRGHGRRDGRPSQR